MRARVALAVLCVASSARAASPLTLTWNAPPECPTRADVASAVDARLGASTTAAPLTASAKVARRSDGSWQVVLSTDQGGVLGERTLDGATCAAVTAATVLILTLTIDPQALSRQPVPLPRAAPPIPPVAPARASPPPRARPHAGRRMFVRVAPALGVAVLANPASAGLSLAFGVEVGRFSVELVANAFVPESRDVDGHAGAGGRFWLLAMGGATCAAPLASPHLRAGGCVGLEMQGVEAEGYGVTIPRARVAGWAAPTFGAFLDVALTSALRIASRVEGVVPLSEPAFVLDGVGTVFRVSPIGMRVSAGIELRF